MKAPQFVMFAVATISLFISPFGFAVAEDVPTLSKLAPSSLSADYCNAFLDEAKKARESRQKADIAVLQDDVNKKLIELKDKTDVLEGWVKRREIILNLAKESILKIYESMDPISAAGEISKMDNPSAAAILQQLKPKKASLILVEMNPTRAATLVALISANSKLKSEQKS